MNLLDKDLARKRFTHIWRVGRVATTTWCGFLALISGLIRDFGFWPVTQSWSCLDWHGFVVWESKTHNYGFMLFWGL